MDEGASQSVSHNADLILVRRAQKGDLRAFDLLVFKYQNKVGALISRLVNDPHDVQDLTQETLIKAYRGLASFRSDSAFYTWLYRIAVNTAKNHLMTPQTRYSRQGVSLEQAELVDQDSHWLQDETTPENSLSGQRLNSAIHQAIKDLPDELRITLQLREFDGLSYEEISTVLESPVGTIRSRIFRAREAVDKKIRPLVMNTVQMKA
ncbi:RNA polymerase sigma factor RpoE [Gynuella sp.]|uniref:RNA polymerase sigma factor RpoE n=1 Tax=Gynuella sp. TaxID=2969146 RepID=UPI003D0E3707